MSLVVDRQPGGLDNATWNRFRTGRLAPTRTLDLHGRTAHRAFHALAKPPRALGWHVFPNEFCSPMRRQPVHPTREVGQHPGLRTGA